ncbi:MAG: AAA family ATPase [Chloroflexota bacterium]|nr:AAA family ATPase [Chloroflexota bacterium]
MLTGFRVQNFKAFEDTGLIDIKSLVLLSGVNSAGKSSIFQALLLLKQTLESGPGQVLQPDGPLFFGTPDSFLFDSNENLVYGLNFAYNTQYNKENFTGLVHVTTGSDIELIKALKVAFPDINQVANGKNLACDLKISLAWGKFGYLTQREVRVNSLQVDIKVDSKPLLSLSIDIQASIESYKLTLNKEKTVPELHNLAIDQLKIDSFDHFLPESLIILQSGKNNSLRRDVSPRITRFLRRLFKNIQNDLSEKVYYLSSFRERPRRFYGYSSTTKSLDPKGSNFPQVMWQHKDDRTEFVPPRQSHSDRAKLDKMPLYETTDWILHNILELKQHIVVQPINGGQDVIEVTVQTLGEKSTQVTLADVGLGYNQILPVIVQGLLTPIGGLVIFEQPEIHLHPDVQAKLIKFFVGLAKSGRRVLVETHSSHMIEHLCLEIAQDDTNSLAQNVQTLFVHAPDQTHQSPHIEKIEITPYGEILNWPKSFLPDVAALDEEIIKAGFTKRQKEQESPA